MVTFTLPIRHKAEMAKTLWKVKHLYKVQGVKGVEIDSKKSVLVVAYAPHEGLSDDLNVVQGALMAITRNTINTIAKEG
jgi:hypothetical protein